MRREICAGWRGGLGYLGWGRYLIAVIISHVELIAAKHDIQDINTQHTNQTNYHHLQYEYENKCFV